MYATANNSRRNKSPIRHNDAWGNTNVCVWPNILKTIGGSCKQAPDPGNTPGPVSIADKSGAAPARVGAAAAAANASNCACGSALGTPGQRPAHS